MRVDVFSVEHVRATEPGQFCVSIRSPVVGYGDLDTHLRREFRGFLELRFHDVESDSEHARGMSPDQALEVLRFTEGRESLVIHCDAGVSRSVAVGAWFRDYRWADLVLHEVLNDGLRNKLVYRRMQEANEALRVSRGLSAVDPQGRPTSPSRAEWSRELGLYVTRE